MNTEHYVVKSLELHLFFGRIMKEHAFFLKAGFTPANPEFSNKAEFFKNKFDRLLCQAVALSQGILSKNVLCSGEIVTEFTPLAEKQTQHFTGITINKAITQKELEMCNSCNTSEKVGNRYRQVKQLNHTALSLLEGLISFKEKILQKVLSCEMFTMNYPLLIEHILREAKLYCEYIKCLEETGRLSDCDMKGMECFWNQIMMEHAQFIRGLLDPCETELFNSADEFSNNYSKLLEKCRSAHRQTLRDESLKETIKFRDFKQAGTEGIQQCKIRSIILPLLADHVLREANHYIRLLEC